MMRKIAHIIGISALVCYAVTAISYFVNNKQLLFAYEVVYFIGICLMLFYLGYLVYLQSKKKEVRENTHVVISALILIGILSFVYMIAYKHHRIYDITTNKRYSLSDQTLKVLESVDRNINIKLFIKASQQGKDQIRKLFDQYSYHCDHISSEFLDPQEHPDQSEKYAIEQYGEVVIETAERQEKLAYPSEELITNAILKLIKDEKKVVAFLTGHAENSLEEGDKTGYSLLKRHLELDNFETRDLLLLRSEAVDADIDCVVIASPKTELFENEIAALHAYFNDGGSILVMIDPGMVESLGSFLTEVGVETHECIIIDSLSQVLGGSPLMPVISQYIPHAITKDFRVASFLPTARFVDVVSDMPEGYTGYALAYTGPGSWAEMDIESLKTKPKFDKETDIPGPVPVMAVIEGSAAAGHKATRFVVIGDSNFIDNSNIGLSGNKDLFLNTIAWLTHEENMISIRQNDTDSVPMFLTSMQQMLIFVVPVIVLPLGALLCGIFVMIRLRRD
ncbi:MAG: GldG family protein [Candidatus Omnitrophica bacterium]|nr:GldG family protein [Candidatus Omnitrophota bacterium]